MLIPVLKGNFLYPDDQSRSTASYYAELPPVMRWFARLRLDLTATAGAGQSLVAATATVGGEPAPVVLLPITEQDVRTLEVAWSIPVHKAGQQIEVHWVLTFAKEPFTVSYKHIVKTANLTPGAQAVILAPSGISAGGCDLECGEGTLYQAGTSSGYDPVYFAQNGAGQYVTAFVTPAGNTNAPGISGDGVLANWCAYDRYGYVIVPPQPPFDAPADDWRLIDEYCVHAPPRLNSSTLRLELNYGIGGTYGEPRLVAGNNPALCPLPSTAPDWVADGVPECQPEPRTDCRRQQTEIDRNPQSPTFGQTRTVFLLPTPTDCDQCPPTTTLPDWKDTGVWRCVVAQAVGRQNPAAEMEQKDYNPYSATYNQARWEPLGNRPDLCPLDPNPANTELWVDAKDESCELIVRCKFDPPRAETTRQKKQIQVNPAFGPATERWVDLAPTAQDAVACPLSGNPIWVAVCPEQIRCKFDPPRIASMTERLEVDVNPASPTVGQQVWRDYLDDPVGCPLPDPPTNREIASAWPLIAQMASNRSVVGCQAYGFRLHGQAGGLFANTTPPFHIQRRWNLARTSVNNNSRDLTTPPNDVPCWIDHGLNGLGGKQIVTQTRFGDTVLWAKVYHTDGARIASSTRVKFEVWVSGTIPSGQMSFRLEVDMGPSGTVTVPAANTVTSPAVNSYELIYNTNIPPFNCAADPSWDNRTHEAQGTTNKMPLGAVWILEYDPVALLLVGEFKFTHSAFINNVLYSQQQGWIKNT
jgi:hypothetical protein